MTEVMYEMKHYMLYKDPMIQRSKQVKFDPSHPITVSGEVEKYEMLPASDMKLSSKQPEYPELHAAIAQLTPIRRNALTRRFGLYGHPSEKVGDIARSEGVTYRAIDSAIFNGRRSLAKTLQKR
jgi:DNA-directed RNA polymerase specialized sigma24 family protein